MRKEKMINDRRVSKWERIIFKIKILLSLERSAELDRLILELQEERRKAREINEHTKATLNGEENWFRNHKGEDG